MENLAQRVKVGMKVKWTIGPNKDKVYRIIEVSRMEIKVEGEFGDAWYIYFDSAGRLPHTIEEIIEN